MFTVSRELRISQCQIHGAGGDATELAAVLAMTSEPPAASTLQFQTFCNEVHSSCPQKAEVMRKLA